MVDSKKAKTDGADHHVSIEKLHELQEELEQLNGELSEKVLEIEAKYNEKRKPVYEKRKEIISDIPNFWLTAFLSHPKLGSMLSEEDREIFTYLDFIDVDDSNNVRNGYTITFNFRPNPYFENSKLSKTIHFFGEETLTPTGTTIEWKEGKGPVDSNEYVKVGNKRPLFEHSFFKWFKDPVEVEQDEIAEFIKEELWPNPIEYLNNDDEDDDGDSDDDDDDDEEGEGEDDDDDDVDSSEADN